MNDSYQEQFAPYQRGDALLKKIYDGFAISELEPVLEINLCPLTSFDKPYTFLYKQNFLDASGYNVKSLSAKGGNQNKVNIWSPIDALSRADADVTLVLIGTNATTYAQQVADPLFQANTTTIDDGLWISNYTVRIVACADQHQFCNPMTRECTALNRSSGQWSIPFVLNGASSQFATGWRLYQYTSQHLIDHNVRSLGKNAFIANSLVPDYTFISPGLPSDKWQREAQRWFETGLAKFQYHAMAFPNISLPAASVPTTTSDLIGITLAQNLTNTPEVNDLLASQCGNQLVKLCGRGQNVSVLGLVILLTVTVVAPVDVELLA